MNNKQIKEIIKIFNKNFKRKDIIVTFLGSIETYIKIPNLKFFLTQDIMILTDGKNKELKIELYWVNDVNIQEKKIIFEMESDYMVCIEIA